MERYFEEEDLQILRENNIRLHRVESVIKCLLPQVSELYRQFKDRGKFYDYVRIHIPMNEPPYVQDLREVDKSPVGTYKYVEDWANEFTGEYGAFHRPLRYYDEIESIAREYVEEVLGVCLLNEYVIATGEVESEITSEILDRTIFEIMPDKISEKGD